jgi:hypothetical protein
MAENEELLRELKRGVYQEIDELKREHAAFKKRVSVISNLLIPGIGFVLYGSSYLKGLISFVLFVAYNYLFFDIIADNTDAGVGMILYIPAVVIWIVSSAMVASLDD